MTEKGWKIKRYFHVPLPFRGSSCITMPWLNSTHLNIGELGQVKNTKLDQVLGF